jgi:hypothetical protein
MTDTTGRRLRRVTAVAIASTFLTQNFAWAVCSDGTTFPPGNAGFVNTTLQTVAPSLANMTPNVFTATAGSVFIPDNSTFENNDPTNVGTVALNGSGLAGLPVAAVGGHNWEFDQGSTTCKATSQGSGNPPLPPIPGQAPAGWNIPPNTTTDCFVLPVAKYDTLTIVTNTVTGQVTFSNSISNNNCSNIPGTTTNGTLVTTISCSIVFSNFGVVPLTSQAIVTTCDPTALATAPLTPNPRNTRLNQLGCSISQLDNGVITAEDQTVAPAYMATASIMGGLFMQRLDNTPNTSLGDAGRTISNLIFFADPQGIAAGTKLTNAIVSPDGHYVAATSIRRDPRFMGCNMPLGNPGRIDSPPVDLVTFAISTDTIFSVKCMTQIGTSGLSVTLANVWGPDNQPYLGGQRTITTAGTTGGNPGSWVSPSAWPQCIALGKGETFTLPAVYPTQSATFGNYNAVAQLDAAIADVFKNHKQGNCQFGPNSGFSASPVIQPNSMAVYQASNGHQYMFTAGTGQPLVQSRFTTDAVGATHYTIRTFFSNGNGFVTGVGVAPDMNFTTAGSVNTAGVPTPAVGATGSGSVIAMTDPTGLGLAAQEVMTRLPLCEDF